MGASIVTFYHLGSYGRLGNTLFQVAATLAYAERTGRRAVFKDWYCEREQIRFADYFQHSLNYSQEPTQFDHAYVEPSYSYAEIPNFEGNVNLHGYFQSEKHFANCPDLIRHYFTPSDALLESLRHRWGDLLNQNVCSIHVRRTDYLNSPNVYPVPGFDYYQGAIERIKAECGVKKFLVFGDDIAWSRKHFKGSEFVFSVKQTSIADLVTMSLCKHNIITNSSFSWWASYLNNNPEKRIIAPNKWILNEDQKDVYRSEWTVI
jgi:Glycosyl transferase family 11.